jgi:hypothetical protein
MGNIRGGGAPTGYRGVESRGAPTGYRGVESHFQLNLSVGTPPEAGHCAVCRPNPGGDPCGGFGHRIIPRLVANI